MTQHLENKIIKIIHSQLWEIVENLFINGAFEPLQHP